MAEFNPKVDRVDTTNYVNYSNRSSGNEGWGTLFEGLAKGADQAVQMGLRKEVNATVNDLDNQRYGTDAVVAQETQAPAPSTVVTEDATGKPNAGLPAPIQAGQKAISGLTSGYKAGSITSTNYAAQLESKVRAMKAQWPGYTDVIDNMVANAMNAPTAQMLRNSIEADRNARATSQQKIEDNMYDALEPYRGAFGEETSVAIMNRTLSPEKLNELSIIVGQKDTEAKLLDLESKRLGITKDVRALSKEDREELGVQSSRLATRLVGQHAEDMLFGAGAADANGYKKFVEDAQRMGADGFDSNELAQLYPRMQQLTSNKEQFIQRTLYAQDENGNRLIDKLPKDGEEQFRKQVDTLYAPIVAALGGDKQALNGLTINALAIKANQENTTKQLLNTPLGQQLTIFKSASELSGGVTDKFMSESLTFESNKGTPLATALSNLVTGKMVAEGTPVATMIQQAQGEGLSTPAQAGAIKKALTAGVAVLTDPNATGEAKANTFNSLYNSNASFLELIDDRPDKTGKSSRMRTFEQMTGPEVLAAMQKLEQEQPGTMQKYAAWVTSQGNALHKTATDTAQDAVEYVKRATVVFVPEKNQFDLRVDPSKFESDAAYREFLAGGKPKVFGGAVGKDFDDWDTRQDYGTFVKGQRSFREINAYLVKAVPILEATGKTKEEAVQMLLMNLDPSAEKKDRLVELMDGAISAAKTVGDYAMPDPVYNAGKAVVDGVGSVIDGVSTSAEDRATPLAPEGGSFVDEAPSAPADIQVDPDIQGMTLPDGTQIQPASYTQEGDTTTQFRYANQGATRKKPVQPELKRRLGAAVQTVLGEGYTVEVYSGGQPKKGEPGERVGTRRHDHGNAGDVRIYGPDGKQVKNRKVLDKLADYWEQNNHGSVGTYMSGMGMHFDLVTKEQLQGDEAQRWTY